MGRALAFVVCLAGCGGADGWEWTPVEEAVCANGASTGFATRDGTGDDLLIYLEGGGACWDEHTCYTLQLAWNIDGYDESTFRRDEFRGADVFDLLPTARHVFIPYCTADLHAGTTTREYRAGVTFHHAGAQNLDAYLKHIAAPKGRVFVVGTSAGGYGAQLNAARFVEAFPGHEVHVMADSAALVVPQSKLESWKEVWGATDRGELPPGSRKGLVTSKRDAIISTFAELSPVNFERGVNLLVDEEYSQPGRAAFVIDGAQHVFLDHLWTDGLVTWLEAWRDGTEDFVTVR